MFAHSHSGSQFLRHLPQHWNSIMHPPHCGQTKLMIEEMRLPFDSPGKFSIVLMVALLTLGFFQKPMLLRPCKRDANRERTRRLATGLDCLRAVIVCQNPQTSTGQLTGHTRHRAVGKPVIGAVRREKALENCLLSVSLLPPRVWHCDCQSKQRLGEPLMKFSRNLSSVIALCVAASMAWADSLELKNGSLIIGKFTGGTDSEISFQVGSSVQKYDLADIASLKFGSETAPSDESVNARPSETGTVAGAQASAHVTIPAGTRISVRTIDRIDSTKNRPGDRFEASLEEPLTIDGNVVVAKGADVYGRLTESNKSGTFTGRSQLQLELTGIVVNGQTVPVVTREYELTGKSRGASTAKRTIGGAAVGSIIGALAGGGKGAGIGAAIGGGAGAGSEVITKGDQVKIPSETLLDFTLEQEVTIPMQRGQFESESGREER
jgi:hypothetical protein